MGGRVQRVSPMTKPAKVLLSLEDAARAMGIGINSLKGLIANGTVYSIPVGDTGKHRRVPVAEVEKWRTGRYDHGTSGASQGQ